MIVFNTFFSAAHRAMHIHGIETDRILFRMRPERVQMRPHGCAGNWRFPLPHTHTHSKHTSAGHQIHDGQSLRGVGLVGAVEFAFANTIDGCIFIKYRPTFGKRLYRTGWLGVHIKATRETGEMHGRMRSISRPFGSRMEFNKMLQYFHSQ